MERIADRFEAMDTDHLERQADEHFAMLEMETMFRDIADPPDFRAMTLAESTSGETPPRGCEYAETDVAGDDAERLNERSIAAENADLIDYERSLIQSASRPSEQEHER